MGQAPPAAVCPGTGVSLTNGYAGAALSNEGDVAEQAPDISFVLDQCWRSTDNGSRLFRAINEPRSAMAACRSVQVTAYRVAYSALTMRASRPSRWDGFSARPLDNHVLPDRALRFGPDRHIVSVDARFKTAGACVVVTLHGASHATQWEDDVTPYDRIAEQVTTD